MGKALNRLAIDRVIPKILSVDEGAEFASMGLANGLMDGACQRRTSRGRARGRVASSSNSVNRAHWHAIDPRVCAYAVCGR